MAAANPRGEIPLQAVLLANSFDEKFLPITLERPKVLFPLANIPMIDYSLDWLESAGVNQVFVVCCNHSEQIIASLEQSGWFYKPNFSVTIIDSPDSVSAGDALRFVHQLNVIHGDFVLISGDVVSNMSLTKALQEHKDRRKKDPFAVMTMVIVKSFVNCCTHQNRLGIDELYTDINRKTKQLLYYKERPDYEKLHKCLGGDYLLEEYNRPTNSRDVMQDCYIDICSPQVLRLFSNNLNYHHRRRQFVNGLLEDNRMGYKIFTHEIIEPWYASRVDNFRSYDKISKDILERWRCPLGFHGIRSSRQFGFTLTARPPDMYRPSEMNKSHFEQIGADIGEGTFIGKGTIIGTNTRVLKSVIGDNCVIGDDVSIEGSYIWNNVTIEDGCKLTEALICNDVVLKSGAELQNGVVLSFKVVVGQHVVVPAYSKISLKQRIKRDRDIELVNAEQNSGSGFAFSHAASSEVGAGGAGYIWSGYDETTTESWTHSVATVPRARKIKHSNECRGRGLCCEWQ